ncbi:MAG: hypothetical protein HC922_03970 [Leptolyngbyaceae cyanobacterium SM2_3_12]|nr:hypothetical protein [Leptolyngbyaceae cyanobacterium SM2_3_12]
MHSANSYWGFGITGVLAEGGWHWRVVQGSGAAHTSEDVYDSPELAITAGKNWIVTETLRNSLNRCLAEFMQRDILQHQEYMNLMQSLST